MLTKLINVAIVDDHTLFRKTLKNYISDQRDLNVVIQSADVPDLLNKLKNFYVHVLVMDVFMPKLGAHEAVKIIRSTYPEIKILALTMCADMDLLSELLDLGVHGLLSKTDEPEALIQGIVALAEQRLYRNSLFTEALYHSKQLNATRYAGRPELDLNEREKEVLQLLWEEKSNKEIADHLFLSVRSVEKIRQDMKEKLGVKSTIGLFKYGINNRIIHVNSKWDTAAVLAPGK